ASLVLPAVGGKSPAMCACEAGDEHLAEWLIAEGVPADLRDEAGRSVLHYAASSALPQLTSWLLGKQNLSPNSPANDGSTALAVAVSGVLPAAVVVAQQLLEAAALADSADSKGRVPLHKACEAGNDRCVRLLLGFGKAKTAGAVDAEGQTPYTVGRRSGLPEATLQRLAAAQHEGALGAGEGKLGAGDESASRTGPQQPGETAAEAEKRELRARKAATSAEASWQTWRSMRPRRDAEDQIPWDQLVAEGGPLSSTEDFYAFDRDLLDTSYGTPKGVGSSERSAWNRASGSGSAFVWTRLPAALPGLGLESSREQLVEGLCPGGRVSEPSSRGGDRNRPTANLRHLAFRPSENVPSLNGPEFESTQPGKWQWQCHGGGQLLRLRRSREVIAVPWRAALTESQTAIPVLVGQEGGVEAKEFLMRRLEVSQEELVRERSRSEMLSAELHEARVECRAPLQKSEEVASASRAADAADSLEVNRLRAELASRDRELLAAATSRRRFAEHAEQVAAALRTKLSELEASLCSPPSPSSASRTPSPVPRLAERTGSRTLSPAQSGGSQPVPDAPSRRLPGFSGSREDLQIWEPAQMQAVMRELFLRHDVKACGYLSWKSREAMAFLCELFAMHDSPLPKLPDAVFLTIYNEVMAEGGHSTEGSEVEGLGVCVEGLGVAEMCDFAKRVRDFVLTSRGLLGETLEQQKLGVAAAPRRSSASAVIVTSSDLLKEQSASLVRSELEGGGDRPRDGRGYALHRGEDGGYRAEQSRGEELACDEGEV
ncbi:unnamed protein product, partial [Polarella glacialis]